MATTRRRLTTAFAATIVGTALVLAATMWLAMLDALRTDPTLAFRDAVVQRASIAVAVLESFIHGGQAANITIQGRLDYTITAGGGDTQSLREGEERGLVAAPAVRARLTRSFTELSDMPAGYVDYLVLFSRAGAPLFVSDSVRQRPADEVSALLNTLAGYPAFDAEYRIFYRGEWYAFVTRSMATDSTEISHVIAGTPLPTAASNLGKIIGQVLVMVPFIIIVSITVAYAGAGRALQPVEKIINDVEAITDGRSLHKRLALPDTSDELVRLAATLNAMMGRLELSFAALRRFTADASHELKTPLAVLRADIERAMDPNAPETERSIAMEESLAEVRRMSDLVDSLLTLARGDEGRFEIHRERVQLAPIVLDVLETASMLGEAADLTVRLTSLEDATVEGDRARLRQLFLNIVSNAIKYTPRGGRVELSLSRRLDSVSFTVRDTGIGIAAADLPHIFERFWRADRARSRASEKGGFGLGLAISQWIAQAHGGSLSATSRLGRGSTFVVTLPFVSVPAEEPQPARSPL